MLWCGVLEKVLQKHPQWEPGYPPVRSFKCTTEFGFQRCWTQVSCDSEFACLFLVVFIHCFILEFRMKTSSMFKFPSVAARYFLLTTRDVILCRRHFWHHSIQMTSWTSAPSYWYFVPVCEYKLALKHSENSREGTSNRPVSRGAVLTTTGVHGVGIGKLIPQHSYFGSIAAM